MQNSTILILVIFGIWLAVLTFFVVRIVLFANKLGKNLDTADLKKVLERVLGSANDNSKDIKDIFKKIDALEDDGKYHIQKVGLVRFNPFKELGGDHSFSLAILDAHDSGIVITGLHTRDRTRVYMKSIKRGKSNFDLSTEEKKALVSAQVGK